MKQNLGHLHANNVLYPLPQELLTFNHFSSNDRILEWALLNICQELHAEESCTPLNKYLISSLRKKNYICNLGGRITDKVSLRSSVLPKE